MKIAVVGCGAVGSYYGAKLCRLGEEVHFLLRSDYATVRRQGVRIHNAEGDFQVQPKTARSADEIGVCDLIIIALKTTANHQFATLLPPLIGPQTLILTLQNGLGNEAQLATHFAPQQILGGLCFVCLNRVAPGQIQHLAHGTIVLGEYQRWPEPRTHDLCSRFKRAGIPCKVTDNLERAHWEKLVWNIPFNGLGVASAAVQRESFYETPKNIQLPPTLGPCLTTEQLLADPRWEKLVRELMGEVIGAANARGLNVASELAEKQIANTRSMGAYRASTLIDFERRQPLELESLFLEPLRQAQQAGAQTPRLAALCEVLRQMNETFCRA